MDLLSKIRYEASGKKTDRVDPISLVDVKKLSKKKIPKVKVKKLVNAQDLKGVEIPTVDAEIKKDQVTLRIKRIYLDQIKRGEKITEYRDHKDFYHKIFKDPKKIKKVLLHDQGPEKLLVEVLGIKVINTPRWLHAVATLGGFNFTDQVYSISLGKILN